VYGIVSNTVIQSKMNLYIFFLIDNNYPTNL